MGIMNFLRFCKKEGSKEFVNWMVRTPKKIIVSQIVLFAASTLIWYFLFFK